MISNGGCAVLSLEHVRVRVCGWRVISACDSDDDASVVLSAASVGAKVLLLLVLTKMLKQTQGSTAAPTAANPPKMFCVTRNLDKIQIFFVPGKCCRQQKRMKEKQKQCSAEKRGPEKRKTEDRERKGWKKRKDERGRKTQINESVQNVHCILLISCYCPVFTATT